MIVDDRALAGRGAARARDHGRRGRKSWRWRRSRSSFGVSVAFTLATPIGRPIKRHAVGRVQHIGARADATRATTTTAPTRNAARRAQSRPRQGHPTSLPTRSKSQTSTCVAKFRHQNGAAARLRRFGRATQKCCDARRQGLAARARADVTSGYGRDGHIHSHRAPRRRDGDRARARRGVARRLSRRDPRPRARADDRAPRPGVVAATRSPAARG